MILINVQPTESTLVQLQVQPRVPPSLVITDGPTTVWLSPHDSLDGPAMAAEFGARLADRAHHWSHACQDYQQRDPDPSWLDPIPSTSTATGQQGRR